MVTVTASLVDSADCLSQQEDETSEGHEVRCSARVEANVVRRTTAPIIVKAPVNPPGATPETLSDSDDVANAVFTPGRRRQLRWGRLSACGGRRCRYQRRNTSGRTWRPRAMHRTSG